MELLHITGDQIYSGDLKNIKKLLDIFLEIDQIKCDAKFKQEISNDGLMRFSFLYIPISSQSL